MYGHKRSYIMASSLLKLVNNNDGTFCAKALCSMATLIYNLLTLKITAGYTYHENLCTKFDFLKDFLLIS